MRPILVGRGTRQVRDAQGTLSIQPWTDSLTDQTAKGIEDQNCNGVRWCGWADHLHECVPVGLDSGAFRL